MTTEEFEARIKENAEQSKRLLSEIKTTEREFDVVYPLIRSYLYLRFMMEERDYGTESIEKLAEISVANIADWKRQGIKINENSGGCSAISSALTKKVLLLISIQKGLDIKFEKNETADITTLGELTEHILKHLSLVNA